METPYSRLAVVTKVKRQRTYYQQAFPVEKVAVELVDKD